MPLTARWCKDRFSATASVHINKESTAVEIYRASYCPDRFEMPSYKTLGSKSEPNSPERTVDQTSSYSIKLPTFARYNLWPRPKKQQAQQPEITSPIERPAPPERSPSSLSDNAIPASRRFNRAYPSGNLANRRKISVPELREKPAPESIAALHPILDSRRLLSNSALS